MMYQVFFLKELNDNYYFSKSYRSNSTTMQIAYGMYSCMKFLLWYLVVCGRMYDHTTTIYYRTKPTKKVTKAQDRTIRTKKCHEDKTKTTDTKSQK